MNMKKRLKEALVRVKEPFRSLQDLGWGARSRFHRERKSSEYQSIYDLESPLVTICIATFNRGQLLVERSLASILAQTYQNIEVIVVGDCCTDDTESRMAAVSDPRVRFINLPERGKYPDEPRLRWMVAGTAAVNHALALASGDFITHLDDDDEHPADRIEKLLKLIRTSRADIVWHPFEFEKTPDDWHVNPAPCFAVNQVTTSSVFYHRWFKSIPWDINAWRYQ